MRQARGRLEWAASLALHGNVGRWETRFLLHENATQSPKLNHPLDILSDYGSPPRTPTRSVLSALATPPRLQTSSPIVHHSSPIPLYLPGVRASQSSSPIPSSLLPTPSVGSDEEDPLIAADVDNDATTARISPSVTVNPSTGSAKPRSLQAVQLARQPTVLTTTLPTRSPSADPLSLFSPPNPRLPTSRRASNGSKVSLPATPPAAPHTPQRSSQSSTPSSPLTPVHSPTRAGGASPRGSSPAPPAAQTHTEELTAEQLAAVAAEEAHGRYSLRTRLARQKNPYAYDKALYKRQMRSNPDAIVKVVSPRRHKRGRSGSAAREGSDGEYSGVEEAEREVDPEEVWRRRRRKSRSRSVAGEAEADGDGEADDEGRSPRPRARHNGSPSKQPGGPPSRKENAKDPPRRITWQPSAFNETFSDSDEGVLDDVANVPEEKKQETVRRKRARPFPMRKKDALRRSSTPEQVAAEV